MNMQRPAGTVMSGGRQSETNSKWILSTKRTGATLPCRSVRVSLRARVLVWTGSPEGRFVLALLSELSHTPLHLPIGNTFFIIL